MQKRYLPGFIDIHTYVEAGMILDGTKTAYLGAAELHAAHGTTALVPTATSGTNEEFKKRFRLLRKLRKKQQQRNCWVCIWKALFSWNKGAQDPKYQKPEPEEYEICSMSDDILRWSSTGLQGSFRFARYPTKGHPACNCSFQYHL